MADEIFYESVIKLREFFTKEHLSVEEVSDLLRISQRQVYRLIRKGELVKEREGIPSWSLYALLKRGYEAIYCD